MVLALRAMETEKQTTAPEVVDHAEQFVETAFFESAPPPSVRRPSAPPPPVEMVGEFLGDPVADAWLR